MPYGDDMEKIRMYDVRLPGAWLDSDTLRKVKKSAGPRGFGAWIRDAIDAHLASQGAKQSAHKCEEKCAP